MKLAYIPPPITQDDMDDLAQIMRRLRPDQMEYALHLVSSWRCNYLSTFKRATKKAIEQRP